MICLVSFFLFVETGFLCVTPLAVLELRDSPASASKMLELKSCTTSTRLSTGHVLTAPTQASLGQRAVIIQASLGLSGGRPAPTKPAACNHPLGHTIPSYPTSHPIVEGKGQSQQLPRATSLIPCFHVLMSLGLAWSPRDLIKEPLKNLLRGCQGPG